jgi:integrase
MVLLGAEAGLRRGEMIAHQWKDIDLVRVQVHVRRADLTGPGSSRFQRQSGAGQSS